jgi:hypothetical protein
VDPYVTQKIKFVRAKDLMPNLGELGVHEFLQCMSQTLFI